MRQGWGGGWKGAGRPGTWARRTRVDVAEVSWACGDGDATLRVRGGGSWGDSDA